jgi:transcriptional regulator with XRE-family HTH domain
MPFDIDERGTTIYIYQWTGLEALALRAAMRLSARRFARRLGIAAAVVHRWDARGTRITPLQVNQEALDTLLGRATPGAYERFVAMLRAVEVPAPTAGPEAPTDQTERLKRLIKPPAEFVPAPPPPLRKLTMPPNGSLEKPPAGLWDDPRLADALEHRAIRDLYRYLQAAGYSQRYIAALTGQSQGEISELMDNGRGRRTSVRSYDLLVRIAEGLGIPRERMGLGYGKRHEPEDLTGPVDAGGAVAQPQHPEPANTVTGQDLRGEAFRRRRLREFAGRLALLRDSAIREWEAGGAGRRTPGDASGPARPGGERGRQPVSDVLGGQRVAGT